MNRLIFSLLTAATLILPSQIATAEPNTAAADPRVKAALEKLGLKYQIDSDGDFKVVMKVDDERTQVAWIMSKTQKLGNLEVRRVVSPAYKSTSPIPEAIANQLLIDSSRRKLGAWQAIEDKNTYLALFTTKIAADSSAKDLGTSLQVTLFTADAMEKTLTGKDDF